MISFTFNMFFSSGTLSSGNEYVSAEFSCSSQHYHFLNVIVSTFFTSHSFLYYLQTLKCPFREIRKPFQWEFWLAINGWRLLRPRVRTFDVLASVADAQFHMEEPQIRSLSQKNQASCCYYYQYYILLLFSCSKLNKKTLCVN